MQDIINMKRGTVLVSNEHSIQLIQEQQARETVMMNAESSIQLADESGRILVEQSEDGTMTEITSQQEEEVKQDNAPAHTPVKRKALDD